jgi:pyruvate ferredoxin oxidoreductase alpha subunit
MAVAERKEVEQEALITGSEAMAIACKLADVDVVTAYPIRPYDTVMQFMSQLISNGEMDCEFIVAEGEHSQFEIVKHASVCGARVFCGSSGVGWMYAMEALTVTPALRVPMVCVVGNRALDDPGAFGTEHNDALSVRDLGWLLTWVDSAQEALDTTLIAYRVAEDKRMLVPCAISADGAFLTHSQSLVKIPTSEQVKKFLPRYDRGDLLMHPDNVISIAPQVNEDWVMEVRRQNYAITEYTEQIIREAYADFERIFGRSYGNPFFEEYMTEDADVVLLGMGTMSMPVKVAIRELRKQGKKVGFVRLRWFRPFPANDLAKCLSRFKAIGVVDRDFSFGSPYLSGVVATEVRTALYPGKGPKPPVLGFICGLGGREVTLKDVTTMTNLTFDAAAGKSVPLTQWIGVRE